MHVMLIGDLGTPHTTGSHLVRALQANGHTVAEINERPEIWADLGRVVQVHCPDFVVWNSTPGYAPPETYGDQFDFLTAADVVGASVVGYHLDLYWSLPEREHWVKERPFFRSNLVVTADGGHPEEWEKAGVDHVWFPPAVLAADCTPGVFREQHAADIAFVGSWSGGYHRESAHRMELVGWLKGTYGARCKFWPPRGHPRIVGQDLNDLYASTKVVVGDSCMVPHLSHYISDRVPETIGRGGYLLHPFVEGVIEGVEGVIEGVIACGGDVPYTAGWNIGAWSAGNWEELRREIEWGLSGDPRVDAIRQTGRAHVLNEHTYEVRVRQLVELLEERKML